MSDVSARALQETASASAQHVRALSAKLDDATGKDVEPLLRSIVAELSVLSSALTRLSGWIDELEPEQPEAAPPSEPDNLKRLALPRFLQIVNQGVCDECGGVLPRQRARPLLAVGDDRERTARQYAAQENADQTRT